VLRCLKENPHIKEYFNQINEFVAREMKWEESGDDKARKKIKLYCVNVRSYQNVFRSDNWSFIRELKSSESLMDIDLKNQEATQ